MKRAIVLACVLGMGATAAFGQTARHPDAPGASAEAIVRALSTDEVNAFLHNDLKVLGSLFSDDFVVTNPFNRFLTKTQVLGMVESGTLAFTSYEWSIEYVHVYGPTAVVAGTEAVVWAGKVPLAGQKSDLRFTAVWMRQHGRWQEVARHASVVPAR